MKKDLDKILSKPASYYIKSIKNSNNKFDFSKPVILFGASKLGSIFHELCINNNIKVLAYCDNDKTKTKSEIKGVSVASINDLKSDYSNNTQIIITSKHDDQIKNQLIKLGFTNIWSHTYFSTIYASRFPILSWNNNISDIVRNKRKLQISFKLLNDKGSQNVFLNLLKYRLTLDKKYLNLIKTTKHEEYFDSGLIKLSKNEVFIDGGAYSGDTLRKFIKISNNSFNNVQCFEPDTISYRKLKLYVDLKLKDKRIKVHKLGLGSKKEKVLFSNEGNLQSKIIKSGRTKIQIVPLDSFGWDKITFLKLDIEGYEKEALIGAKKMIINHKPKLAICSYHHLEDLWEIPLLINKLNPSYKIHLRHYGSYIFDTICYAV